MTIPSPIQTGYYPERDKHCKEALRGRFLELEDVKFKDIKALQEDAYLAGWAPPEVQRAVDALVTMRQKKLQTAIRLRSDVPLNA